MESKRSIIALLGILMSIAALAAAQPTTPFLIDGWVNYTDGNPVNDPSVTVTNQYTSEVFTAETNASSDYYQILTSSDNVSAGNVLHFVVSKGSNSTEFDHTVSATDVGAGGFERNATIGPAPDFVCGDCDQYAGVTTNDGWLIYMNLTFPGDSRYAFTNAQAADCDIYSGVTTNDGWLIYMNLTFPGNSDYVLRCD